MGSGQKQVCWGSAWRPAWGQGAQGAGRGLGQARGLSSAGAGTDLAVGLGLPQRLPVEGNLLPVILGPGHCVVGWGAGWGRRTGRVT